MTPDLREDLRQRKPFLSLEQEAQLNVVRTASLLVDAFEQMLKPYGITATQYNVLRILRGAEPEGLCRNELRDRMLTRMPDVTRLLDRMEDAKLVARARDSDDRRLVSTRITPKGLRLLDELQDAVTNEHMRRFHHLSKAQLKTHIELLGAVRYKLSHDTHPRAPSRYGDRQRSSAQPRFLRRGVGAEVRETHRQLRRSADVSLLLR